MLKGTRQAESLTCSDNLFVSEVRLFLQFRTLGDVPNTSKSFRLSYIMLSSKSNNRRRQPLAISGILVCWVGVLTCESLDSDILAMMGARLRDLRISISNLVIISEETR